MIGPAIAVPGAPARPRLAGPVTVEVGSGDTQSGFELIFDVPTDARR